MREEEEPNWFARWEEQLPSPDELTPLSQSLITLPLAMAFDIVPNPNPNPNSNTLAHNPLAHHGSSGPHFDPSDPAVSSAGGSSGAHNGCGADEPARTLKRPRLVWTPQLHKRFVDAVAHLGIKNAVPKTIMQLMSVDGLTRENVASHLQKYRLYLKRMQGIGTGGSSPSGNGTGPLSASEAATEQLFASGPVPHHFLTGRSPGPVPPPDPYIPFVPVSSVPTLQHHHHHQMGYNHHQFYNQRSNGLSQFNGFDHNGFFTRSVQVPTAQHHHRVGPGGIGIMPGGSAYMDELEMTGRAAGGAARRELTLFPTGDH